MSRVAGLLTDSREVADDFQKNYPEGETAVFRSLDAVKRDISVLVIDCEIFESPDLVQFLLSKIRKKLQEIPVLLVVRVNQLQGINRDLFMDDFILYPFRREELLKRIERLLWNRGMDDDILNIGQLKINLKEYIVYLSNERVDLTYKEFELLRLLVENRGVVFTRKDLLNRIWGMEYIGGTRTVDVHIRRLRGKLGDEFNSVIETVRNVGYKCMV